MSPIVILTSLIRTTSQDNALQNHDTSLKQLQQQVNTVTFAEVG